MESIDILACESYLPNKEINNDYYNKKFNIDENWIEKRTGINKRYFADEKIEDMALNVSKKLLENTKLNKDEIDFIIVATTSSNNLMPGISHYVQKHLEIEECICLDVLAGCGGYPNAFDIAYKYITMGDVKKALVIGVDKLSEYINEEDINTSILFGDGAGAILIGKSDNNNKLYKCKIKNVAKESEILICDNENKKIYMDGTSIYKFAVTETVKIVNEILDENNINIEDIKYIIPHQSNQKILDSIAKRLKIDKEKVYTNLSNVGNTFCASIPIAFSEIFNQNKLNENDKVILLGYGGGLNTSCILLEI